MDTNNHGNVQRVPRLDLESLSSLPEIGSVIKSQHSSGDIPIVNLDHLGSMPKSELLGRFLESHERQEQRSRPTLTFDDATQYAVQVQLVPESEVNTPKEVRTVETSLTKQIVYSDDVIDGRDDDVLSDDELPESWSILNEKMREKCRTKQVKEKKEETKEKKKKKKEKQKEKDTDKNGRTGRRSSLRENFYLKYSVDHCSDYSRSDAEDDVDGVVDAAATDEKYISVSELVDDNSAMFDNKRLYLHPVSRMSFTPLPTSLYQEFFGNLKLCANFLRKCLFFRVLNSETDVRHYPDLTLNDLERSITYPNFSEELGDILRNFGDSLFTMLHEQNLIGPQVTLNVTQEVALTFKGQSRVLRLMTDLLGCNPHNVHRGHDYHSGTPKGSCNTTNANHSNDLTQPLSRIPDNDGARNEMCDCSKINEERLDKVLKDKKEKDILSLALVVCPRDSIDVTTIIGQYLLSMTHRDLLTYILALHVGPLVSKQELVLYQFRPRTRNYQIPEVTLDQAMALWDRYEGRLVFPVTSIENMAKLSIYDYPGLSKEKKQRQNWIHLYLGDTQFD